MKANGPTVWTILGLANARNVVIEDCDFICESNNAITAIGNTILNNTVGSAIAHTSYSADNSIIKLSN